MPSCLVTMCLCVQITGYRLCQQIEAPGFRPLNLVEQYLQFLLPSWNGNHVNWVDVSLAEA